MAEFSREELLQMLKETEEPKPQHTAEVRGRMIVVDDAAMRSWATVTDVAALTDMDGLHATVALMGIVTRCTDLSTDDVLAMAGGHDADFGEVAEVLAEISQAIFPKA